MEDALKIVDACTEFTFASKLSYSNIQVRVQSFGRDVLVRCPLTLGQTAGAVIHFLEQWTMTS